MFAMKITIVHLRARSQQRLLFEEPPEVLAVHLPTEVRNELRQSLIRWMQALAKTIRKESGDE